MSGESKTILGVGGTLLLAILALGAIFNNHFGSINTQLGSINTRLDTLANGQADIRERLAALEVQSAALTPSR